MDIKFDKYMVIFLSALIVTVGFGSAWAEKETQIMTINKAPEFSPDGAGVPGRVLEGTISEIHQNGVIFGDVYHPFSGSVIFLSAKRKPISRSDFDVGEKVEYRLNSKGEIVVMWIEEEKE